MWVTLCAIWQGFKLTMTTKTLVGWFCLGKQHVLAYIPSYFIFSLHFLQWYLFVTRTPYHQGSCDLEWWVGGSTPMVGGSTMNGGWEWWNGGKMLW